MSVKKAAIALLYLVLSSFAVWPQTATTPPGWFEGDAITEASLSGIWWINIPFQFKQKDSSVAVVKQELNFASKYMEFGPGGIIHKSNLDGKESIPAIGVWMLKDNKLTLTFAGINLELNCFMVHNDKILIAGDCQIGQERTVVSGILYKLTDKADIQIMQE